MYFGYLVALKSAQQQNNMNINWTKNMNDWALSPSLSLSLFLKRTHAHTDGWTHAHTMVTFYYS